MLARLIIRSEFVSDLSTMLAGTGRHQAANWQISQKKSIPLQYEIIFIIMKNKELDIWKQNLSNKEIEVMKLK